LSAVTGRRWKKAVALHCALILKPNASPKELKKLAQKILSLGEDEDTSTRRIWINDAQCVELVWANSQCVKNQTGHCPLLIFGKQLADHLNQFFNGEDDENTCGRGRRSPASLAEEEID
jgi:hypothetical protein